MAIQSGCGRQLASTTRHTTAAIARPLAFRCRNLHTQQQPACPGSSWACLAVAAGAPSREAAGNRRAPMTAAAAVATEGAASKLQSIDVTIVGAGPSGLLLAHRLLAAGASVTILEARGDPRSDAAALEGRAYALGLGIRGRTAIRTAGASLWDAIKPAGLESESFKLHFSPTFNIDLRTPKDNKGLEPSLLIYQSDLCGAMLDQLEARFAPSGRLSVSFGARVQSIDALAGTVVVRSENGQERSVGPADLVAGCDGVNSVVRSAIAGACPAFTTEKAPLPGNLKVVRFPTMPSKLDGFTVHAIPGAGGCSAFIEPTARGACALITWRDASPATAAKPDGPPPPKNLGELSDAAEASAVLAASFPLLADVIDAESGRQFVSQSASRASTVRCNTYHCGRAVLLGDAAHSTGGVSGQGCNTALADAVVLADVLEQHSGDVGAALMAYSLRQVPEGHALLDLSLGPSAEAGPLKKGLYGAATLVGTLLSKLQIGPPPLQTQLTTSLEPIAEIRRKRDFYFGKFPSQEEFKASIAKISSTVA